MTEQEQHQEILQEIGKLSIRMESLEKKLIPIHELFTQARGFNNVARWLLFTIIKLGAALAVLYGAIKWLKQ